MELKGKTKMDDHVYNDIIVCRCEEITLAEIKDAIREGARDATSIKRRTRAGMGLCQGRTCEQMIQQILMSELHLSPEETGKFLPRLPQFPVTFEVLARRGQE